jgi:uncharacterized protein (TIGR03663 family)
VSTASTKRDRKKNRRRGPEAAQPAKTRDGGGETRRPAVAVEAPEMSDRAWLVWSLAVLAAAALLRLVLLDLKPFHHDEGVNGFFLEKLLRRGEFKYDPTNYHGPTLYYLTLPVSVAWGAVSALFGGPLSWEAVARRGLNNHALRLVTAGFGVGTVALLLCLRRYVGAAGALSAAALLAFSPGAVYYSRYYIHESLFVFFTLAVVVAALRFYETGGASYLMLCAASAALLFATKETAFISVVTLALALLVAWGWWSLTEGAKSSPGGTRDRRRARPDEVNLGSVLARFGDSERATFLAGASLALFVFVFLLFYSSFFTNWQGVADAFRALVVWQKTGASDFHAKPFLTYVRWLWQEEAAVLLLAVAGSFVALFERRKNRFAIFAGAWAFGLLLAYSLVPYKTPWLALNFVLPMAVAGGYAVGRLNSWTRGARAVGLPALIVMACALALGGYQTLVLNFREYDNDQYPYVYSHTQRGAVELVREVQAVGRRAGTETPGISVASPDYWPLPWYFRENPRAGYEGRAQSYYDPKSTLAVVGKEDQLPQLQKAVGENYRRVGEFYPLRPGVRLVLFARRDLAN